MGHQDPPPPGGTPCAYLAPLLLLVGTAASVIPDLISGWAGDGAEKTVGIEALNVMSLIGLGLA